MSRLVEDRAALAPYVGREVTLRATVARDGGFQPKNQSGYVRTTLLIDVELKTPTGEFVPAGTHFWCQHSRLVGEGRAQRGDRIELIATVSAYEKFDPSANETVTRHCIEHPSIVANLGPRALADSINELCRLWGTPNVRRAAALAKQHHGIHLPAGQQVGG